MKLLTTLILLILATPLMSFAQYDDIKAKVGVNYGYTVPNADNTQPHRAWGVTGDAMLTKLISIGGYYLIADKPEGSGGRKFETSYHGIALAYHVPSNKGDTFYSLRAGLGKLESVDETTGDEVIFSPYHWGIAAGYDYRLYAHWSIGFEGSYFINEGSDTSTNGTTYTEDSYRSITFSVSSKILF